MDTIERLAKEHGTGGWQTLADMVRFGEAVAAAEREACAKVCEGEADRAQYNGVEAACIRAASAIMARSNKWCTPNGV